MLDPQMPLYPESFQGGLLHGSNADLPSSGFRITIDLQGVPDQAQAFVMTGTTSTEHVDADTQLLEVRMKAEAHCQLHIRELMEHAREAVAQIRTTAERYGSGQMPPDVVAALRENERRAAVYRRHFVTFAVRGAVLAGRIPETREAEALARCADDDGLTAFLDEMAQIPLGFIDRPTIPAVRH